MKNGCRTVATGDQVCLKELPSRVKPLYQSDEDYSTRLQKAREEMDRLQELLYAEKKRSVLIVFQGMDTAGKDGAIKHVMSGLNPQGCQVVSFKTPTATELAHDFLWRVNCRLPERGEIGIFNRSHYEELLVPLVHQDVLERENIPGSGKSLWQHRYRDIVHFEKYLIHQGIELLKVFLHISKKEQKQRLLARFESPQKMWKLSSGDVHERQYWSRYRKAYEKCFEQTSFDEAPWHIVPADDKKNARLVISRLLLEKLRSLKLKYPQFSQEQKLQFMKLRRMLERE